MTALATAKPRRGRGRNGARVSVSECFDAANARLAEGASVAEAVWSVIGPCGTRPLKRFLPPDQGGRGDKMPRPAHLVAYYSEWRRECMPEVVEAAALEVQRELVRKVGPAVEVLTELSSGDFQRFEHEVRTPKGEVGRGVDAKAADVSLKAATTHLMALGAVPRPGGGGVTVTQTNVQGEAVQVNLGDALKALRRRESGAA